MGDKGKVNHHSTYEVILLGGLKATPRHNAKRCDLAEIRQILTYYLFVLTNRLYYKGGMNKLHRRLEYALMALRFLDERSKEDVAIENLTTAKEIAENYSIPFDVVARVLQQMAQKGLLKSTQGINGGYSLATDLKKENLFNLIEIVQGKVGIAKCMHSPGPCEIAKTCQIASPVHKLNSRLIEFYRGQKLLELIRG